MPYIDKEKYNKTEAKQGGGGGFEQMEPGVYELYIQAIRLEWTKKDGTVTDGIANECVRIVWDVASGPFEKKFTEAYFVDWDGKPSPDKDFMHSTMLSWKKLEYFKSKMEALKAANQGFEPLPAFEQDQWDMFIGKRFWAVVDGEVDLNDNGYDRWKLEVGAWITPEQACTGEHPEPKVTDNRGKKSGGSSMMNPGGAQYAV